MVEPTRAHWANLCRQHAYVGDWVMGIQKKHKDACCVGCFMERREHLAEARARRRVMRELATGGPV